MRVQGLEPDRADALLAGLWALAGLVAVAVYAPAPELLPVAALTVLQGVGLSQRRRHPLAAWVVAFGFYVPHALTDPVLNDALVPQFIAGMFATYSLGANLRDDRAWPFVAVLGGAWYFLSGFTVLLLASQNHLLSPWSMGLPFVAGQLLMAALLYFASGEHDAED